MAKNVTLQDVADHAQVSIATVSRILNSPESVREATRLKVLKAMTELGFSPNVPKLPDASQSKTILIMLQGLVSEFDNQLAGSIVNTAFIRGYNALTLTTKNNYQNYEALEKLFNDISPAGIILHAGLKTTDMVVELQRHYPVVMCSDYLEDIDISYVSIDDIAAAKTATNYLISTGHTKIGLVNCNSGYRYSKHRKKGYIQALLDAGLDINENWMIHLSSTNYFLALSSIREMLERKNRPDAIFACCDTYGMAAITAANQLGIKVPEELSIIGFDNTTTSSMTTPSLTTVAQPINLIGSQTCEMLIEKIKTKSPVNKHIILDTELIIRNSTCPKNI